MRGKHGKKRDKGKNGNIQQSMERRIVEALASSGSRGIKTGEIMNAVGLPKQRRRWLQRLLRTLTHSGRIVKLQGGRYMLPGKGKKLRGRVSVNTYGIGFFSASSGEEIYISPARLRGAIDGDLVEVELLPTQTPTRRGSKGARRREGVVVKVIERGRKRIAGILTREEDDQLLLLPSDPKLPDYLEVSSVPRVVLDEPAKRSGRSEEEGVAVIAEIDEQSSGTEEGDFPSVKVLEALGDPRTADAVAAMVLTDFDVLQGFSPELERPPSPPDFDGLAASGRRKDLRELLTFTIDGEDAKDFDDAISIEKRAKGGYILWVHIADVGEYVPEGSALDEEARERATSIYYPGGVTPMLPHSLSDDLCCLRPREDRLALTCELYLSGSGEVTNYFLYESIIHSDHRLTYEQVERCIKKKEELPPRLTEALELLASLTKGRIALRERRGGLDLFIPEARVKLGKHGRPLNITRQKQLFSYRMIEEAMLLANEAVASLARRKKLPILYREHEEPDPEKLAELKLLLKSRRINYKDLDLKTPHGWQTLIKRLGKGREGRALLPYVLRAQMRARYRAQSSGHFGLALRNYCHFTSPIRRYPDLHTHRIIKAWLRNPENVPRKDEQALEALAAHCTEREMRAETIERIVVSRLAVVLMENKIGKVFPGTVTGIAPFGLFVSLDSPYVDGLVPIDSLLDDYYEFVPSSVTLRGETTNRVFRIGDRVDVMLYDTDFTMGRLEFVLPEFSSTFI